MSNGLPSYGRYVSRPTLAELEVEVSTTEGFPFQFALVTFADNAPPVVVFNQTIYPFLAPGDARTLVDANGETVVSAAPDTVTAPTRYLVAQNASGTDPVELRSFEEGAGAVDLLVMAQGAGLAVLTTNEGDDAIIADGSDGVRALRRTGAPGTPAQVFHVDHICGETLATGDGATLDLRILPEGDPFGGTPISLASITASVNDPTGTPSSSVDIAIIGDNVLTLNGAGAFVNGGLTATSAVVNGALTATSAVVNGSLTIDKIIYDTSMLEADRAVGSETALSSSTSKSVTNSNVVTSSIISVTPRSVLAGAVQWWVEIPVGGGSFEVHFDSALSADWAFDFEVKGVAP